MGSEPVKQESGPALRREAGLFQVVTYGLGNIIGAGIYVLIGDAAGLAGNAVWLSFLAGAVVALFTGLTYAELSSMYPRAASEYIYLGRAYGSRLLAFLAEWMMLITEVVAAAAVSIGFAGYLSAATGLPVLPASAALLVGLTTIAALGIKSSLGLNTVLSTLAIGGLIFVIVAGLGKLGTVAYTFSPGGASGVLGASALVFFAYVGFDNMTNLSEETKDPEKTVPRGILISVGLSTALYVGVGLIAVSLVPFQALSTSEAPLALAASAALGPAAYDALTVVALFTTLNTVLVLLIVSSRILYGMGAEGILPALFAKVGRRTGTPYVASLVTLLLALALLPLGTVSSVAKVTSFGSLLTFALVNLAMLHLRRVAPGLSRPFRAPINLGWLSVTAVLGLASSILLLTQFDLVSVALGLTLPISGAIVYYFVGGRIKAGARSALHERHEHRGFFPN